MPPYCPAAQPESTNGTSSMCKKQVHEFDGKENENCFNNTSSVARSVPMSSCDIADGLSSQSLAQDYREVCEPLEFPQTMVCPCVTVSTLDYLDACTGHANDRISCEFEVYDRKLEHIVSLDLRKNMKQVVVSHSSDRCKEGYSSHVFILGRVLQKAIYGQVRYARMLSRCGDGSFELSKEEFAIKCLDWKLVYQNVRLNNKAEDAFKECAAMQFFAESCSSSCHSGSQFVMTMEYPVLCDNKIMYMIMPYMNGGEMYDRLQKCENARMNEEEARYWMWQIVLGVHAMHSCGICHRDLSLENILIHGDKCKIIDFGMALHAPRNKLLRPQGICGKDFYMSPETYHNETALDPFASDVWSIGVILFMMLIGSAPYVKPDAIEDKTFPWVTGGKAQLKRLLQVWNTSISEDALDLLSNMLCVDTKKRFSLKDILEHKWMRKVNQQDLYDEQNCICM